MGRYFLSIKYTNKTIIGVNTMFSNQRIAKSLGLLSLVFLTACVTPQQQTQAGEYVEDSVITTKVKAAIFNEPTLKSAEINVETFKAVVQLSGFVNSGADMNRAVEVTRGVTGVQAVKNDMRLQSARRKKPATAFKAGGGWW